MRNQYRRHNYNKPWLLLPIFIILAAFLYHQADKLPVAPNQKAEESKSVLEEKITDERSAVEKALVSITREDSSLSELDDNDLESLTSLLKRIDLNYLEFEILSNDPQLKQFRDLYKAILKSSDQIREYHNILKNEELLIKSREILTPKEKKFSFRSQVERMIYVDLICSQIRLIEDSNGPFENKLHELIEDIMLNPVVFNKSYEVRQRQSMYGDRIEIFKTYATYFPVKAREILNKLEYSHYQQYLAEVFFSSTSQEPDTVEPS